jgi:outer membrane protein TolC
MKMRPLFLLCGLSATAWAQTPVDAPMAIFGLPQLLHRATGHNLVTFEARTKREKAALAEREALAGLLPTLSLEGSADTTVTSQAGIFLRQPIYANGSRLRALKIAGRERERLELLEKQALENLSLELLRAFVSASSLARSKAATERRRSLLETQFDLMSRQYRQGLKTRRDFQRLETERERVQLQILRSAENLNEAFQAIEVLVGDPTLELGEANLKLLRAEDLTTRGSWPNTPSSFDPSKENLELRSLALAVEIAELQVAEARREYWPQLFADATLTYGSSGFLGRDRQSWGAQDDFRSFAGLTLKWTLWDWGATQSRVGKARLESAAESRRESQRVLALENSFSRLLAKAQRQERAVTVQRKIRDMENEIFVDMNKEYREGRAGYLDLITTLDRSVQADLDYENEAFDAFSATAELLSLKGALHEAILKF